MRAGEVVVLYYDFLLRMERKRVEKLRYMHRNPVKRGVVARSGSVGVEQLSRYAYGEVGPVLVNEQRPAKLQLRVQQGFPVKVVNPTLRTPRRVGHPQCSSVHDRERRMGHPP